MQANSQGRLQDRHPVSIIDIGSNSIRLVIYEGIARSPTVLFNEKMLAGLGRGIVTTGKLDPHGVRRAVEEFRRFRALSEQAGARALHVIATAAAREATNGPNFIHRAEEILGTKIRVLTGREEAAFSAQGIISSFEPADGIVGDLGGGSLELVDVRGREIGDGITLPLGSLRLHDMSKGSTEAATEITRAQIARAELLKAGRGRPFYCVGGAWRNLARLHMMETDYPLDVMHHYEMEPNEAIAFLDQVSGGKSTKMTGIDRISKSRRGLLPQGAMVLREIVRAMQPSKIIVSASGVREGYLYTLMDEAERAGDPLISAAEELAKLRARSVTHARELAAWSGEAFRAFGLEETADEARYRHAACLLADIGWRAHPEYRGTQSLNIIAHASFIGVDHPGRAFLALATMFRHEGVFEEEISPQLRKLAGPRYLERARILGALLRVVYLLSASMPGVIPTLSWRQTIDGKLQLVIPKRLGALMGERPAGRLGHLSRVLKRPMELVVSTSG
ncbi:exopolyphosphatase [Chelativorans sp. ZYF759]|uniref:exopolyphosphatase n=1 Tax=Chelativorans sp. ZYF759 TaxID=2692213 RepID=UPI00145D05C3|nr:exopolyphosphatase [Chelativorans sp. ZYF759]NMG38391.1 exopolyphosphatase [Chelativorans sp. ZYF759]